MSMAKVLERLERRAAGEELADAEMRELRARARTYARRLARLREAHPDIQVELSPQIQELLAEPAISA
jgi:hypothetical protein